MRDTKAWKIRRWRRDPRCAWCGRITILFWRPPRNNPKAPPPLTLATVDHLRDRFDPDRREPVHNRQVRRVLACWLCNAKRGWARQASQPIEELRRRAAHTATSGGSTT